MKQSYNPERDIAIIGMAGRFPGADSVDQFWANIVAKRDAISFFEHDTLIQAGVSPDLLSNPKYIKAKGFLENASLFDADFFGFSKHDAIILDPQYRLFLETVWEALENAAYAPEAYTGKIGLFAGSSSIDSYFAHSLAINNESSLLAQNFNVLKYNAKDFLTMLLAYKLNLRGPAITIQTGCSSSLVATCMACQSLLSLESDIAIAGGVSITVPLKSGYLFQDGMMLSPSGQCRAFDKDADGSVSGNGLGVVVLKRLNAALNDGDHIHAIIKGFAVNNDGHHRMSFTAPSIQGQQEVIETALARAKIKPEMISYIEAHGTGTILGDLIECSALTEVFKEVPTRVALGSVKPNIGHLDVAAGISGLIKTVQALKHKVLPPNIHFNTPNPHIDFNHTPFYINTESAPWDSPDANRYAGVSSFGIGGTNAHIVLQEAPASRCKAEAPSLQLFVLSARTPSALAQAKHKLARYLQDNPLINHADVAYTLQVGRKHFKCRDMFVCLSTDDAITKLSALKTNSSQEHADTSQEKLGRLWLEGQSVDWSALHSEKRSRVPLPSYPFERQAYWISREIPGSLSEAIVPSPQNITSSSEYIEKEIKRLFEYFLVQDDVNVSHDFQSLGGDSLVALQIGFEINKALNVKLPFSIFEKNPSVKDLTLLIVTNRENKR